MFDFIFDIPLILAGPVIIAAPCLFTWAGLVYARRRLLPRMRVVPADSEFIGAMLQSIMVFYGLAVALIAVNVWQTYTEVEKIVSGEATTLAALYRDVTGYPQPIREKLQSELRDYVRYTIDEAWKMQQQGKIPTAGLLRIRHFQDTLVSFEPPTEGQKLLHAETLRAYNTMIQARTLRLNAVKIGLPGVMWGVIIFGAAIGLASSFFFRVDDFRVHGLLSLMLALFIGMVMFMIVALDRPFRGDLGITADSYELVYGLLMNGKND